MSNDTDNQNTDSINDEEVGNAEVETSESKPAKVSAKAKAKAKNPITESKETDLSFLFESINDNDPEGEVIDFCETKVFYLYPTMRQNPISNVISSTETDILILYHSLMKAELVDGVWVAKIRRGEYEHAFTLEQVALLLNAPPRLDYVNVIGRYKDYVYSNGITQAKKS